MNNFGIAHFSFLWLMLKNTFLKLTYSFMLYLFIKSNYFLRFLSEKLTTYRWFCIFTFTFNTVSEIISRTIFSLKNKRIFLFYSLICLKLDNVGKYIGKTPMKRQTIWRIMCWNRWRIVEVIILFSEHTVGYRKIPRCNCNNAFGGIGPHFWQ